MRPPKGMVTHLPRKHDCCRNWEGSSKALEPDVAAELAVSASQHGAQVAVFVGDDDDASAVKKVRDSVSHGAEHEELCPRKNSQQDK